MKKNSSLGKGSASKALLSRINRDVLARLRFFVKDENVLAAALIQRPFEKTIFSQEEKKKIDPGVRKIITVLNSLYGRQRSIFKKYSSHREVIILYLISYLVFFENLEKGKQLENKKKFPLFRRENVRFAMDILERLDVTEIRTQLEDRFFSILEPEIYNHYQSLLGFTREKFIFQQRKITLDFRKILREAGIKASIQSRLKTIYSVHKKIIKKNLLYSQILDTIGIRIIVKTEDECYKVMVAILKKNPVMTSHIKDYIAIPKENGYRSIHLTILIDRYPVEIQIRTREMHQIAQYGIASHARYKNNENPTPI